MQLKPVIACFLLAAVIHYSQAATVVTADFTGAKCYGQDKASGLFTVVFDQNKYGAFSGVTKDWNLYELRLNCYFLWKDKNGNVITKQTGDDAETDPEGFKEVMKATLVDGLLTGRVMSSDPDKFKDGTVDVFIWQQTPKGKTFVYSCTAKLKSVTDVSPTDLAKGLGNIPGVPSIAVPALPAGIPSFGFGRRK